MNYFIIFFVILTAALCPTLSLEIKNGTLRIELIRQKTTREEHLNAPSLKEYGVNFDWFYKKHHGGNRTNDSIALYRYLDNEFYGKVVIGHPGQTLNVAFDTAWSLSWVLSSKCNEWKSIGCWLHNRYDHTKSSEYKKDNRPYVANEGKYNLTGFYSYDNFSIAHSNATAQSFVEMVTVPWTFLFNKIDGVLGLGMKTDSYNPFFYTLLAQKKIQNPIFSIYLNRDRQSNKGGNILLGFVEPKHIHVTNKVPDPITYLAVDAGQYWKFTMDRVEIVYSSKSNYTLCPNGCKVIADTSTNTIVGPQADIDKIHDDIKAKNIFLNRYSVDCETVNKLPKIDFILGGQPFRLEGSEYIIKMSYMSFTVCLSSFVPTATPSETGLWVLGGAFLSEYYSIYDVFNKKIGFVKAA
ncbi:aspartic proteinase A2-like [Anoplophora glabripennis]|uniref:aspartic proteinase A2-like n=1 Tax=Anoplophora glabripennis TaxID=217634 RepID=UPI0008745ED3|nr:aspartic proteinase A2-like [Anoplophora glabripennis]